MTDCICIKRIFFAWLLSVFGVVGIVNDVFGQTTTLDQVSFTPMSPNTAELFKYVSTPVDKMTGVPGISFPLYTVSTGKIKLPISLSYHASGIKVDQQATWVGLGWSLNAGGVITRQVRGMPDEKEPYGWFEDTSALTNIDSVLNYSGDAGSEWSTMYTWCTGSMQDTHPDFFSYSLPSGKSGRFIYSRSKKMFMPIPYQPVVISHLTTDPDNGYSANLYSIVDDDGTKYLFEAQESFLDDNTHLNTYIQSWYLTRIISNDLKDTVYLNYSSGVLGPSANQGDLVNNFGVTYTDYGQGSNPSPNLPAIDMNGQDSHTSSVISTTHSIKVLQSIVFRQGKIDFFANTVRKDCPGGSLDSIVVYSRTKDTYMTTNVFRFNHSYFASYNADLDGDSSYLDYRLKLDSFSKQDLSGAAPERYKFGYSSVVMPPLYSFAADYWGFYNGKRNNQTLLPDIVPPVPGYRPQDPEGTAIRDADDDSIMTGMLQRVTYPTGGYTIYSYEPNKFTAWKTSTLSENVDSGSLYGIAHMRTTTKVDNFTFPHNAMSENATFSITFSPIALNDDIGQVITLTDVTSGVDLYTFTHNGDLTVTQTYSQAVTFDSTHQYRITAQTDDVPTSYIRYSVTVQVLDSSSIIKSGGGTRVKSISSYDADGSVKDQYIYKYGQNENGLGWMLTTDYTIYQSYSYLNFSFVQGAGGDYCFYNPIGWEMIFNSKGSYASLGFQGATALYNYVTQYQVDQNGVPNGKTLYVYNYPSGADYSIMSAAGDGNRELIDNSMMEEQLAAKYDYSYDKASTSYALVQSDVYRYQLFSFGSEQAVNCWINNQYFYTNYPSCAPSYYQVQNDFGHVYYYLNMGGYRLARQTHTDYDVDGDSVQTEKGYRYNNPVHLYPNVISMIDSKGDTLSNQISYPSDQSVTDTNVTVLTKMAARNMYDKPFLKQDFNNGTELRSVRTFFSDQWDASGNTILPKQQVLSVFNNGIGTISKYNHFDAYDSFGNVLQMQNQTGINTSFLWDYWGTYVVAGANNATVADVAYTSFEADGTGNWSLSGGAVDTTQAITGRNSYQNGTITASGLNPATTYIVSYWSENGVYNVPGTISGYPVQGKTVNFHTPGWTLYVHKVTGQSSITVNATGHIDELRLYPATAQMTTYTYDPLVGMTTQMDAGSRATYYEYDGLQRLKRVRDQDYNILKTIDYAYQAPAGCGNGCYSVAMQTFAGTNTLSYPVGVFDVNGNLVGNATNAAQYVGLWNNDTADTRVGTLSQGQDSMHFNIAVNAGQTLPASVTGLRYYQMDLPWNRIDAVRQFNGAYIDFGDGTAIRMPTVEADTPAVHPPYTVYGSYYDGLYYLQDGYYFAHNYADSTLKTITCYHNDTTENTDFDNWFSQPNGLHLLRNLRGYLPQHTNEIGGSCYQQASMTNLQGIQNWNSISSVKYFRLNNGDGIDPCLNISYPQDFMANNKGLIYIKAQGCADTSFKISRLKSDWNTYFTQLSVLWLNDPNWNHENLSALTQLSSFLLVAGSTPISSSVVDNIIMQIATGAGKTVTNGTIAIATGGGGRTPASQAAVNVLLSKGWVIVLNGVYQTSN